MAKLTTAVLRNDAQAAEKACDWIGAARLWDAAIERHPGQKAQRIGQLDRSDIARMTARAEHCRSMARHAA